MAAWYGDEPKDEQWRRAVARLKVVRDAMRVLSFTQDAPRSTRVFGCSWARPRMWEQYGEVHRGACLLFDREALEPTLKEQFHPDPAFLRPVHYSEGAIADDPRVRTITDEGLLASDVERQARALFNTSSSTMSPTSS